MSDITFHLVPVQSAWRPSSPHCWGIKFSWPQRALRLCVQADCRPFYYTLVTCKTINTMIYASCDILFKYKTRVSRTPRDRKFDLADVRTLRSDGQLLNPLLELRSKYAIIRNIRSRIMRRLSYSKSRVIRIQTDRLIPSDLDDYQNKKTGLLQTFT